MMKMIFELGIIGTGLLAITVLGGSSAYVLADIYGWKEGLSKKFKKARSFYIVIAILPRRSIHQLYRY